MFGLKKVQIREFVKNEEKKIKEIENYETIIRQMKNDFNYYRFRTEINALEKNKEEINTLLISNERTIKEYKNLNEQNKENLDKKTQQIEKLENQINKLKEENELKRNKMEKNNKQLNAKIEEAQSLNQQNILITKKCQQLQNNIDLKNKELESFKEQYINKVDNLTKELNLKNNELQRLKNDLISKNAQINTLEMNYKSKEKDLNNLTNVFKLNENKLNNLHIRLEKTVEELNEANIDRKKINKDLKEKNERLSELQINHNQQVNQINNLIKNVGELSNDNKKLKDIESEIKKKEKENFDLRKENENLLNTNSTRKEFIGLEDLKDFYDVVIEIDSINTLTKTGWKIDFNEKRKDVYEKVIKEESLKIGVLGLNNIGKTFILGLLSGCKDMPSGWSVETKGISIKYTEGEKDSEKGICLLDSAGIETPLLDVDIQEKGQDEIIQDADKYNSFVKKLDEIAKDKGQTERFIEELIISLSDMLILVVGKLTRREQNFITRVKDIINEKENNKFKSIIIIHNLAQYNELEEINKHIEQVLKKSATFKIAPKKVIGIKNYEDRVFYAEEDGTDHFIMARQDSKAGKEYNDLTIELIKRKFNDCKARNKIDIPNEIVNLFSKMSKDIIEDNIDIKNLHISKDLKTIKLSDENQPEIKKEIKCQKTYIDEMGKYNTLSNKFIPKYSYYVYKEKKKKYILLIRVEIPGNVENLMAKYEPYGKKKIIKIKGIKKKDDIPERNQKGFVEIQDNRNYEEINYTILLREEIELNQETPISTIQYNEFEFNRFVIDEEGSDEDDENEGKKEAKEEKIKIASGVYIIKFEITQTSFNNISKIFKKQNI